MASSRGKIAAALGRIAAGAPAEDIFAVARTQVAGEPVSWFEEIAFELHRGQSLNRIRSPVDDSGARIGLWREPADAALAPVFAAALCDMRVWEFATPPDLAPGADIVQWSCITRDGTFDVVLRADAIEAAMFQPLDLLFRRLANGLEARGHGAALRLEIRRAEGLSRLALDAALINDGDRPCLVLNPYALAQEDSDFLAVECAAVPEEIPGMTGLGPEFRSVLVRPPADLSAPWTDEWIVLPAHASLRLPGPVGVPVVPAGPRFVRLVYSFFGQPDAVAGMPVIHGRVFSNVLEIDE